MAARQSGWLWLLGGGAVAYWLYRQNVPGQPVVQSTPGATTPRGGTHTTTIEHAPVAPMPPSTTAPSYAVAHPCAFSTTETHAVYNDLESAYPAALLGAGSTVTTTEKRVSGGATWFRAWMRTADLSFASSGHDRQFWFRPNDTERARCAE